MADPWDWQSFHASGPCPCEIDGWLWAYRVTDRAVPPEAETALLTRKLSIMERSQCCVHPDCAYPRLRPPPPGTKAAKAAAKARRRAVQNAR